MTEDDQLSLHKSNSQTPPNATMADANEEDHDLVDYDEEEEEENVVAEKTADGDSKEVKK